MINFWAISILLTLLASLFLLVPIRRFKRGQQTKEDASQKTTRDQENVHLFKERIAELELEKQDNKLLDSVYEQRKQELELALLNDVNTDQTAASEERFNSRSAINIIVGVSIFFVAVFSFWMYQSNGSKTLVDEYYAMSFNAQELAAAKELAQQGDMSALLNQLHEKLQAAPDNLEGWQLLVRSAMNSQRYVLAIEAYEQIIRIYKAQSQNPAPIYGLLAQAKYYESGGKLTPNVEKTIDEALSLDESELNTLGLLAINAFSTKQFLEAKNYWLKILEIYPEHPARVSIESGIQRVNAQLGLPNETMPAVQVTPDTESVWVDVKVDVDASIKSSVKPDDTVFIIAKSVDSSSGPKVPLAVSRHRVDELPITVRLDDTKSMAPIAKLSMAQAVKVVARISKSGNPIAQVGDFEAVSTEIRPDNKESIQLVIQNRVN